VTKRRRTRNRRDGRRHDRQAHPPAAPKKAPNTPADAPPARRPPSAWLRGGPALAATLLAIGIVGVAAWAATAGRSRVAEAAPAPAAHLDTTPTDNGVAGPIPARLDDTAALAYAGRDARHRPRYVQRAFTDSERTLLRRAFGIADPNRLWLPDSVPTSVLRYDATAGGLAARVGYRSWRLPGETWEAFADRLQRLPKSAWPASARQDYRTGLDVLEPAARATFAALLADARAAGFRVRMLETDRSPERQAYLLVHGNGRTLTATSAHVYGRAVDFVVDDGNIHRRTTRRDWIAFRRWVLARGQGRLRLIGTTYDTWDWPHVELVEPPVGFRSVDALLEAARACLGEAATGGEDRCAIPRG